MGELELLPTDVIFHHILEDYRCAVDGFDRRNADCMGLDNALLHLFLLNPLLKLVLKDRLKVCRVDARHECLPGGSWLSAQLWLNYFGGFLSIGRCV